MCFLESDFTTLHLVLYKASWVSLWIFFCVPGGQQHNHGMLVSSHEEKTRLLYKFLHHSDTCKYIFCNISWLSGSHFWCYHSKVIKQDPFHFLIHRSGCFHPNQFCSWWAWRQPDAPVHRPEWLKHRHTQTQVNCSRRASRVSCLWFWSLACGRFKDALQCDSAEWL